MPLQRMNEVVVVEGKNDTHAIRRAVIADTIETNGSAIPEHVLEEIKRISQRRGVIVFTDPDSAGERIRRVISRRIPEVMHAFLPRQEAMKAQKVGVEYASPAVLLQALNRVRRQTQPTEKCLSPLSREEYIDLGFTGQADSAQLRARVARELNIGYANGKQFYQRLGLLQISRAELWRAIVEVKRG